MKISKKIFLGMGIIVSIWGITANEEQNLKNIEQAILNQVKKYTDNVELRDDILSEQPIEGIKGTQTFGTFLKNEFFAEEFERITKAIKERDPAIFSDIMSYLSNAYTDASDTIATINIEEFGAPEVTSEGVYDKIMNWFIALPIMQRLSLLSALALALAKGNKFYVEYQLNQLLEERGMLERSEALEISSIKSIAVDKIFTEEETKNITIRLVIDDTISSMQYTVKSHFQRKLNNIKIDVQDKQKCIISKHDLTVENSLPVEIEIRFPTNIIDTLIISLDRHTRLSIDKNFNINNKLILNTRDAAQAIVENISGKIFSIVAKHNSKITITGNVEQLIIHSFNSAQILPNITKPVTEKHFYVFEKVKKSGQETYLNAAQAEIYASNNSIIKLGEIVNKISGKLKDSANLDIQEGPSLERDVIIDEKTNNAYLQKFFQKSKPIFNIRKPEYY